jgi:hypothetical protein
MHVTVLHLPYLSMEQQRTKVVYQSLLQVPALYFADGACE